MDAVRVPRVPFTKAMGERFIWIKNLIESTGHAPRLLVHGVPYNTISLIVDNQVPGFPIPLDMEDTEDNRNKIIMFFQSLWPVIGREW